MKKLILSLSVLVIIIIVGLLGTVYYFNSNIPVDFIRKQIVDNSKKILGRKITVGNITGTLFKGIKIEDVKLKEKNEKDNFVSLKTLYLDYKIWPLLHKKLVIKSINLDSPEIAIVKQGNIYNFSDIKDKINSSSQDSTKKEKSEFSINIASLTISNGKILGTIDGKKLILDNFNSTINPNDLDNIKAKIGFVFDKKIKFNSNISTIISKKQLNSDIKISNLSISKYWNYIEPFLPEKISISGDNTKISGNVSLVNWKPDKYNANIKISNLTINHPKFKKPVLIKDSDIDIDRKLVTINKLVFANSGIKMSVKGKITDYLTKDIFVDASGNIPKIDLNNAKNIIKEYKNFPVITQVKFGKNSIFNDISISFKGKVRGKMKNWKYFAQGNADISSINYSKPKDQTYVIPAFSCVVKLLEKNILIKNFKISGIDKLDEIKISPFGKTTKISGNITSKVDLEKILQIVKNNGVTIDNIEKFEGSAKFNNFKFNADISDKVTWDFNNGFLVKDIKLKLKNKPEIVINKGTVQGTKKEVDLKDFQILGIDISGNIKNLNLMTLSIKGKKSVSQIIKLANIKAPKFNPKGSINCDITLSVDLSKKAVTGFKGKTDGNLSISPKSGENINLVFDISGDKKKINLNKFNVDYKPYLSGKIAGAINNLNSPAIGIDFQLNNIEHFFEVYGLDAYKMFGNGTLSINLLNTFSNPKSSGTLNLTNGKIYFKGTPTNQEPNPKPFIIPFDSINAPINFHDKILDIKNITISLCDGILNGYFNLNINKPPFIYKFGVSTKKNVRIEKILFENKKIQNLVNGEMTLKGDFTGKTDTIKNLKGKGYSVVKKGTIQFPKAVSPFIKKIPNLEKLVYDDIYCDLNINNGFMYLGSNKLFPTAKMYSNGKLFSFTGNGNMNLTNSYMDAHGTLKLMPDLLSNSVYNVDNLIKSGLNQVAALFKLVKLDMSKVTEKLVNKFKTEGIPVSFSVKGKIPDELEFGMDTNSIKKYAMDMIKAEGKKFFGNQKKKVIDGVKNKIFKKLTGSSSGSANKTGSKLNGKSILKNLLGGNKNSSNNVSGTTTENKKKDGKSILKNLFKF